MDVKAIYIYRSIYLIDIGLTFITGFATVTVVDEDNGRPEKA